MLINSGDVALFTIRVVEICLIEYHQYVKNISKTMKKFTVLTLLAAQLIVFQVFH